MDRGEVLQQTGGEVLQLGGGEVLQWTGEVLQWMGEGGTGGATGCCNFTVVGLRREERCCNGGGEVLQWTGEVLQWMGEGGTGGATGRYNISRWLDYREWCNTPKR